VSRPIDALLARKVNEIDKSEVEAIGLMGSYSRGEAKLYSDVDLVCLLKQGLTEKEATIEIIEDTYVVTSYVTIAEMEECFTDPDSATVNILGLQQVKILYDLNETFENLRVRAYQFRWTEDLQAKANELVSKELVGWIEEVHKALQGFISDDVGRMLNGIFGLTYGIFTIVRKQKGILLNGENSFYTKIVGYYGFDSSFAKLAEKAWGIGATKSIKERVVAGLLLFDEVTDELMGVLREEDKPAVVLAKREIHVELKSRGYI